MSKLYLNAIGINKFEWVDKPEDAKTNAKKTVEVTLKQLQGAKLERAPKKIPEHEPDWIISTEV